MAKLTDFKALTFDCYGTLIDWETGMIEGLKPLTSKALAEALRATTSSRRTRATNPRSKSRRRPNSIATCSRLFIVVWPKNGASRQAGAIASPMAGQSGTGRSFADTVASLQYLKRHYKLAILSNVDNESFSFSNEKLGVDFDAVYTAEDCGSYKPSPRNFEYMLAKLRTIGIEKNQDPAHRREPVSRPRAGERAGPCLMLDLSAPRPGGLRRDHGSRARRPNTTFASTVWPVLSKRIRKR